MYLEKVCKYMHVYVCNISSGVGSAISMYIYVYLYIYQNTFHSVY